MDVLNVLCTLWIHTVATAAEQCVHSAVQLLHAVRARFSVLLWWHEWTSVSYCEWHSINCVLWYWQAAGLSELKDGCL